MSPERDTPHPDELPVPGESPFPDDSPVPEIEVDQTVPPRPEEEIADVLRATPDVEDHSRAHGGAEAPPQDVAPPPRDA